MTDFINKIIGDIEGKKEWKELEARAKALPEDYQTVYNEIKNFVWKGGAGVMDPSGMFKRIVETFEKGAADGKRVMDVTGSDVAKFAESMIHDEKTYADGLREKLNDAISKKLGK